MCLALLVALPLLASPQEPPLRVLVVTGQNNHEWQWTSPEIASALTETGRFAVTITNNPATDLVDCKRLAAAGELQVIVLDYNGDRWGEAAERGFLDAVNGGVGVTVLHAANNAFKGWTEYERMVGLLWRDGTGHGAYHPFDVNVVDRHHAVTAGMPDMRMHPDELYHRLVLGQGAEFRVLMAAFSDPKTGGTGQFEPMATVATFGKGRIFHTPLGHVWKGVPQSRATWLDPQLRRLVARGTEWAASGAVTLDPRPLNWLSDDERAEGFQLLFDGPRTCVMAWLPRQADAPEGLDRARGLDRVRAARWRRRPRQQRRVWRLRLPLLVPRQCGRELRRDVARARRVRTDLHDGARIPGARRRGGQARSQTRRRRALRSHSTDRRDAAQGRHLERRPHRREGRPRDLLAQRRAGRRHARAAGPSGMRWSQRASSATGRSARPPAGVSRCRTTATKSRIAICACAPSESGWRSAP
jgi:type 1 glutamine amidotransferase